MVSAYGCRGSSFLISLLRRIAEEVERRKSLRKSFRPFTSSAWLCSVGFVAVRVPEDEQKRLAIFWFGVSGGVDKGKIVELPAQDGELFWERKCVRAG